MACLARRLSFLTLILLAASGPARVEAAEFVWFGSVTCNGTNNPLLAFDDGEAFVGSFRTCSVCPPTDTLNWNPAPCGNILASAGRSGDRILLLFELRGVCGNLLCVTADGYVLAGSDAQCWSPVMEGRNVFQVLGSPAEAIVGAGTDSGSQLYLLTASGNVLRVQFQGVQFQFVSSLGRFTNLIPTTALRSTWGRLKARYR